MSVVLMIALTVLFVGMVTGVIARHRASLAHGVEFKELKSFSEPSKRILKLNQQLPEGCRVDGITDVLRALDIKYEIDTVTNHFQNRGYESAVFSWNCCCSNGWDKNWLAKCEFPEYHHLKSEVAGLLQDYENREHALKIAQVQSGLDRYEELLDRIRTERTIINDVTKELT